MLDAPDPEPFRGRDSAGRVAVLAFGVVLLVSGGCRAERLPADSLTGAARTSIEASPDEQPFTRVTPPPARPPRLALLRAARGRWSQVQVGALYNGEWIGKARRLERVGAGDGGTVPWPEPARLESQARVAIGIPDSSIPRTLLVRAFDARLQRDGAPAREPVYELECTLEMFQRRQSACSLQSRGDGYALPLQAMETRGTLRVSINASWVVPAATTDGDIDTVWATWLFATETDR